MAASITRRRLLAAGAILLPVALLLGGRAAHAEKAPLVAAAASLRFALEEIAADFKRATGQSVRLTFGATGTLALQIQNGAPYELLFAADEISPAKLETSRRTKGARRVFARGALALVVPKGSTIALDGHLKGLGEAVRNGKVKRFAIANPELAPYGAAAKKVLMRTGLWDHLAARIVTGESVGQAAQFVATGAVEAGLVALSLTRAPELSGRLDAVAADEGMYTPLNHALAVMNTAGPIAISFAEYCMGSSAREIFARHGFLAPD